MIKAINVIISTVLIPWYLCVWVALFGFTLCMNIFTIPLIIVIAVFCKVFKLKMKRPHFFGCMLCPSISDKHCTLLGLVAKYREKQRKKYKERERRQFVVTRPWEARFFN